MGVLPSPSAGTCLNSAVIYLRKGIPHSGTTLPRAVSHLTGYIANGMWEGLLSTQQSPRLPRPSSFLHISGLKTVQTLPALDFLSCGNTCPTPILSSPRSPEEQGQVSVPTRLVSNLTRTT